MVKSKSPDPIATDPTLSPDPSQAPLPDGVSVSVSGPPESTQDAPQVQVQNPDQSSASPVPADLLQQRAQRDHMQSDGRPVIPPSLTDSQ